MTQADLALGLEQGAAQKEGPKYLFPAQVANLLSVVAYFGFGFGTSFGLRAPDGGRVPVEARVNYLTPFPIAFAIWFAIYAGTVVFAIWQILQKSGSAPDQRLNVIQAMSVPFCAANLLTIAWMLLPLDAYFGRGVALTASAIALCITHGIVAPLKEGADYWCMTFAIGIHFGWLTAASLVTWNIWVAQTWMSVAVNVGVHVAMIVIAFAAGAFITLKRRSGTYGGAVAWATFFVAVEHFFPRDAERLATYNAEIGEGGRYLLAVFELLCAVVLAGVAVKASREPAAGSALAEIAS